MTGDISVVIPAYNAETWVGGAITSVLEQDRRPHEVVVVDDGSTDATSQVVADFGDRVRIIRHENRGLGAARNSGARCASGRAVLFLDADDLLLPNGLAVLDEALEEFPSAGVINPGFELEDPQGSISRPTSWVRAPRRFSRRSLPRVIYANPLLANSLVRKEVVDAYPYDETLPACEDLDLWLRLLRDDVQVVRLNRPIIRRRVGHPTAMTAQVLTMRRCRRVVFEQFASSPGLGLGTRSALAYQLLRSAAGEVAAASSERPSVYAGTVMDLARSDYRAVRLASALAHRVMKNKVRDR